MKKMLFLVVLIALGLRVFHLTSNPPAISWDEASLGYNAFTISTSGKDEHGEFLPLARFIAFGDYKPPGYIYTAVPFVKLLGLSVLSIRLPSVIAGIGMVIVTFFLVNELFGSKKMALLSSFFLAVSSWSIFLSRAAYESNLASFFNLCGIYFLYLSFRKKWTLILSVFFFWLSFYTFNANRIIAPVLFITLVIFNLKQVSRNIKWFILSMLLSVIFLLPSISYLQSRESRLRFQEVSIFNNLEPIKLSNTRLQIDGMNIISRVMHNRRVIFALDFLKHYSDNFKFGFLFSQGDVNPRLNVQSMGQLYVYDLFFMMLAVYFISKRLDKRIIPIIIWMLIAPIPAGTARETPHALRILSILPTFQIISAYGLYYLIGWARNHLSRIKNYFLLSFLIVLVMTNIFYFLHDYLVHFPIEWSGEWQYGYKEMVQYVLGHEDKYDYIYVTSALGRPYIYFAFYKPYNQQEFIQSRIAERDWYGFWDVKSLGKINFDFKTLNQASGKVLVVSSESSIPQGYQFIKSVKNLKGENVFYLSEKL